MDKFSQAFPESGFDTLAPLSAPDIRQANLVSFYPGAYAAPRPVVRSIISLEDILGYILKRWKPALVSALLVSGMLFFLMIARTPVYKSGAGLLLRTNPNKIFNFENVVDNSMPENSIPYLLNNHKTAMASTPFREFFYNTMSEEQRVRFLDPKIVKRNIAGSAVAGVKKAAQGIVASIRESAFGPSKAAADSKAEIFEQFEESIHIDLIHQTHILTVSVSHPDAQLAAELANLYCETYIHYTADQDLLTTRSASEFLRKEAAELKKRVEESERQLFAYRQEQGLMEDDERKDITAESVKAMGQEMTAIHLKLAEAEQYLDQIRSLEKAGRTALETDAIANDPVIGKLRDELALKGKELAIVASTKGARHPTRMETENAYRFLSKSLEDAVNRMVAEIENRAALYRGQSAALERRLNAAEGKVFAIGEKNIDLTMLRKQLAADQALYDSIVVRLNEASVTGRFNETGTLLISDTAVPAVDPSSPNVPLSAVVAVLAFCGVFTGLPVGIGLARDTVSSQWFQRVRHAASSDRLARVPSFEGSEERQVLREALGGFVESPNPELMRLANEIEIASPRPRRTLLITSAASGEGKSFMAAALANLFAAQGKRALVIDCNLRKPAIQRWLPNDKKAPTLRDWLESDGRVTFVEGDLRCGTLPVFALNAGGESDVPSGFLAREAFRNLIDHARNAFDVVIIDTPGIEGAPEVFNLVPHASDVLFVWDKKKTPERRLAAEMSRVERIWSGTRLLGAVENRSA